MADAPLTDEELDYPASWVPRARYDRVVAEEEPGEEEIEAMAERLAWHYFTVWSRIWTTLSAIERDGWRRVARAAIAMGARVHGVQESGVLITQTKFTPGQRLRALKDLPALYVLKDTQGTAVTVRHDGVVVLFDRGPMTAVLVHHDDIA